MLRAAISEQALGNLSEAIELLERAQRLKPHNLRVRKQLSELRALRDVEPEGSLQP
jgi:Flp pilus assembly protein TadD